MDENPEMEFADDDETLPPTGRYPRNEYEAEAEIDRLDMLGLDPWGNVK